MGFIEKNFNVFATFSLLGKLNLFFNFGYIFNFIPKLKY